MSEVTLLARILIVGTLISTLAIAEQNFFSFKVKDIHGEDVDLSQFKGKVTLVLNTASQCSLTDSHFKSLKRLHDILSFGNKFNVIVFPSNDFGEQEPWDENEIEEYIRGHFRAEFLIMGKTKVVGSDAVELWKWIGEKSLAPAWNFHKYLIGPEGTIVKTWPSDITVESIFEDVRKLVDSVDDGNDEPVEDEEEKKASKEEL